MPLDWFETSEGRVFGNKYSSENGRYFAIVQGDGYHNGKFEHGRCWLYGPTGELFSPTDTIRPRRVAVANSGVMIVGDLLLNTGALHSRLTVYAPNGELLVNQMFRRNCTQVAISPEGNIAIIGTANPANCIRIINVGQRTITREIEGYGWFNDALISERERTILVDGQHRIAI